VTPVSGDPCPGFVTEPGRCWRTIYGHNLQATHCGEVPSRRDAGSTPEATAGGGSSPVPTTGTG
jgi:hypothetical protein